MKIGYSAGLFGISAATSTTGFLLMFCYTDVFGIAPAAAGFVIVLGSAVDIAGSLLVPWLTSKSRSRLGRYRPFIIYGSVPLGVFLAAMFIRPDLPQQWLYPFVVGVHLLYRASYAMVLMPHASLISRLTHDADERASIGAAKAVASNLATATVATVGMTGIEWLGGHTAHAFTVFGIVFGVLIIISVFIAGISTKERVVDLSPQGDTSSIWRALSLVGQNREILTAFLATVIFFIGYGLLNGGIVYYFKYVLGYPAGAKYAVLGIAVGGIIFPQVWAALVRRTSKAFVWSSGCIVLALALVSVYFLGLQPLPILFLAYLVGGIGKCAIIMNYFAITADAVDYGQWKSGARVEAYSFGFLSLSTKVGESLGSGLLGVLLAWTGFIANHAPGPLVVSRLRLVTCLASVALLVLSAVVMAFFRVNATRHRDLMRSIAEMHSVATP